jgi:chromosome segregation ATPase
MSEYKPPPTRSEVQDRLAEQKARREHAPHARAAAKRDRRAAIQRERPAKPEARPAIPAGLRRLARAEADLRFRLRAISASQHACTETKRAARRLEPELERARLEARRAKAATWADTTAGERYAEHTERLEAEAAEFDDTVRDMLAEHAQLREQGAEITAVLAPLTASIDAACARLGRSRAELRAKIAAAEQRLAAVDHAPATVDETCERILAAMTEPLEALRLSLSQRFGRGPHGPLVPAPLLAGGGDVPVTCEPQALSAAAHSTMPPSTRSVSFFLCSVDRCE